MTAKQHDQLIVLLNQILDHLKAIREVKDAEESRKQEAIDRQDAYESRRMGF